MNRPVASTPIAVVFTLFLLSGATSLVYEVLWLRKLILIFGSTQFATSTILATFMAGLALGAFLGGRWLNRSAAQPMVVYGLLELGIALYAILVPVLFRSLSPAYQAIWDAGGARSFVLFSMAKFVGIALVLLPPALLMGASLPALAREVADDPGRIGGKVGALYAVNTFGAVTGTFVAGFVAIPAVGVTRTLWITAIVNAAIGGVALILARRRSPHDDSPAPVAGGARPSTPRGVRFVLLVFGLSGFGALVLEVAWTRVLALIMGSSVYAFSLMLLAFLVGLALGSAALSAWLRRRPNSDPALLLTALLALAGALAYATTFLFPRLPGIVAWVFFTLNPGADAWFVAQFLLALLVMFPTTFALGGIFPVVLQFHARRLEHVPGSVGTVYASNTAGTIVGAAVAGFVLLPSLGVQRTVIAVAVLELLLALAILLFVVSPGIVWRKALTPVLVGGISLVLLVQPRWDTMAMNAGVYMSLFESDPVTGWAEFIEDLRENHVVVYAEEGLTATVFVADQPEYDNRYLAVNGKIEASSNADLETQLMLAHLPLLLHGDARDVLVVGLASGITVGSVATHPVERIRVVELERAMVRAASLFAEANNNVLEDDRLELSINDARNELEFNRRGYDVIISEPSNPWMTVASNLFTEEFFRMVRERVNPGGVFCQWVQSYYLGSEDMRSIIASFKDSFPHVMVFEMYQGVDLLLVGSKEPLQIDLAAFRERMSDLRVAMDLQRVAIRAPEDLLNLFRMGTSEVERLVAGAPRNTDDNARVEFSAPKTLGVFTLPQNVELIHSRSADPLEYVVPPLENPEERDRLTLRLAQRWAWLGDWDLALAAARRVSGEADRVRAEEIVAQARAKLEATRED